MSVYETCRLQMRQSTTQPNMTEKDWMHCEALTLKRSFGWWSDTSARKGKRGFGDLFAVNNKDRHSGRRVINAWGQCTENGDSESAKLSIIKSLMEFGPQQIGKWLILMGITIVLVGALVILLGRIGLFRLPGDLEFGFKNWRLYLPIASCIIISIVLTVILWLINYFRR